MTVLTRAADTERTGRTLLAVARNAIGTHLGVPGAEPAEQPWMREPGATFITIMSDNRLRGCIGTLLAHRPLIEDVRANAVAAATRDPRFPPMPAAELPMARLELSWLSPLALLHARDETEALRQLRPGVDGVVFEYGYHTSTFLPQVWADLPDAAEFLGHLKQKAGLPPDFWHPEVKLQRYTVSKWRESDTPT
jgi:AmmeMemoRadiSam system protein A